MKIEINGLKFELSTTSKTFLEKYLERMKHFIKQNDIEIEVYDDIEERISEKFAENLSDKKTKKIEDKTVIDIVNEIGEPSEILEELIDNDFETKKSEKKEKINFKKHFEAGEHSLTRNSKEGILFGVCYGIGERYNIDPLWIRLLFVLVTPLRGMSVILYIVLIFLLPNKSKKKDNSIIEEVENLTDSFVSDIKEATEKIDFKKYKKKFSFKKSKQEEKLNKKSKKNKIKEEKNTKSTEIKEKIKNVPASVKEGKIVEEVNIKNQKGNIFIRFIVFIFVSIKGFFIILYYGLKYIFIFTFHTLRYVIAFALLAFSIPILIALVFVSGTTFTSFQFDNQALFTNVDLFLKIGIVGILASLLFLIFGIFLKFFRSKSLASGILIIGMCGIFISAFIGGLGSFATFNEYKNIYTETESFEFETKDFKLADLSLFGEERSLIEGLNWIDSVNFEVGSGDKIIVEIESQINSKSKETAEQIFSQLSPYEISKDNGTEITMGNKSTFKTLVPYSFLRKKVTIFIPKNVEIEILDLKGHYRTNLFTQKSDGSYRNNYLIRDWLNGKIIYNEELGGFVWK